MKAVETNKREAITGNYTNSELIRHIENEFPELSGSLLVLLKRFDDQCADDDNPNARNEDEDIVVKYPKCGTQLQIEENNMRPMLAEDFIEGKLRFPLGAQPKIDGVRGLNMLGSLTGRSLKSHKNRFTSAFYSQSCLVGLDGELAANSETHPDLCRITSSAVGTISGEPYTLWWLFDYVTFQTKDLTYEMRYAELVKRVAAIQYENFDVWQHLRVVPMVICHDQAELDYWEEKWLAEGYEGVIIRDLLAHHKQGRSTVREMGLLRIKRFIESECLVTGITEGNANENEAQTNELGKTFRSSHQENKVPNGMVGHFTGKACQTVKDPSSVKIVINEGDDIIVSPGKMPHDKRKFYFENPGLIVGQVIKFKFFPKGIKDKPRFPTYVSLKIESDI